MRAPRAFVSSRGPAGPRGGDLIDIRDAPYYAGQTDNRTAIANAVAAANISGQGIFIPEGEFEVDTGTNITERAIDLPSGMRVIGTGIRSVLKRPAVDSTRSIFRTRTDDNTIRDILLRDFTVDWNVANTAGGPAVIEIVPDSAVVTDGNNIHIDGLTIRDAPYASWALKVYYCDDVTIENCRFEDNGRDNLNLAGCTNGKILYNRLYGAGSNGGAEGDDNIALYVCDNFLVHGNTCYTTSQDVGRNLWLLGCSHVTVSQNDLHGGWRQNISVWAEGDTSNVDSHEVRIINNTLHHAGQTSAGAFGSAIELNAAAVDVGFPISDVDIEGNHIHSPRTNGIIIRMADNANLMTDINVLNNRMRVDRAAAHVDGGNFFRADLGATGDLKRLTLAGNRSWDTEKEAVYLRGDGIHDTVLRDERHRDNGTTATPLPTYYFEDIRGLVMEGCDADDYSGGSRINYGAQFVNLSTAAGVKVRISGCDFTDTNTGDVSVTGAFPVAGTDYYDLFNFGAAALP